MLSCVLLLVRTARAADSGYYVQKGSAMFRVTDGAASKVVAKEWQIRLYKKNGPTSGPGSRSWGLITGKSADSVNRQLASYQTMEKGWEKCAGMSWGEDTYFNPLGPIAIVESDKPKILAALDTADSIVSKLKNLKDGFDKIMEAVATEPKENNPFASVGTVLKEYTDNFKDVQQKLAKLKQKLAIGDAAMSEFSSGLNEISRELPTLEKQGNTLLSKIGSTSSVGSIGRDWMSQSFTDISGDRYHHSISVEGSVLSFSSYTEFKEQGGSVFVVSGEVPLTSIDQDQVNLRTHMNDGDAWSLKVWCKDNEEFKTHEKQSNIVSPSSITEFDINRHSLDLQFNNERDANDALRFFKAVANPTTRRAALQQLDVIQPTTAPATSTPVVPEQTSAPKIRDQQVSDALDAANKAYDTGNLAEAGHQWRLALQLNPNNPDANGNLGLLLYQKKDYKGAEPLMRKAMELAPQNARIVNNLGQLYLDSGKDPVIAEQLCRRATELDPKDPNCRESLAECLLKLGKREAATAEARKALQLGYPGNEPIFKELHLK